MTTYNPSQCYERHRRAKVQPPRMALADYLRCVGVTAAFVALLLVVFITR